VTEDEAIKIIIEHLKGLFPKTCPKCQRHFATLREFYLNTKPEGRARSYDLEAGEVQPKRPIGAVATSTCTCGESISLTSQGMPLFQYWALLLWAKTETRRRNTSVPELLFHLRTDVRKRVMEDAEKTVATERPSHRARL